MPTLGVFEKRLRDLAEREVKDSIEQQHGQLSDEMLSGLIDARVEQAAECLWALLAGTD